MILYKGAVYNGQLTWNCSGVQTKKGTRVISSILVAYNARVQPYVILCDVVNLKVSDIT